MDLFKHPVEAIGSLQTLQVLKLFKEERKHHPIGFRSQTNQKQMQIHGHKLTTICS